MVFSVFLIRVSIFAELTLENFVAILKGLLQL